MDSLIYVKPAYFHRPHLFKMAWYEVLVLTQISITKFVCHVFYCLKRPMVTQSKVDRSLFTCMTGFLCHCNFGKYFICICSHCRVSCLCTSPSIAYIPWLLELRTNTTQQNHLIEGLIQITKHTTEEITNKSCAPCSKMIWDSWTWKGNVIYVIHKKS